MGQLLSCGAATRWNYTNGFFPKFWALLVIDHSTAPNIQGYQNRTLNLGTTQIHITSKVHHPKNGPLIGIVGFHRVCNGP